jgi:predicted aspartyl protease
LPDGRLSRSRWCRRSPRKWRPYREVTFSLADGTTVTRKVGDAYFEINGDLGPAPVIFGEKGDEPLLGATTLESLGLVLDPFKRRLIPMRMVLA